MPLDFRVAVTRSRETQTHLNPSKPDRRLIVHHIGAYGCESIPNGGEIEEEDAKDLHSVGRAFASA